MAIPLRLDAKPRTFGYKAAGYQTRKAIYWCLGCHAPAEAKRCANCGSKPHYFPSTGEQRRYAALWMEQHIGVIEGLTVQVNLPCKVNGVLVCTYRADFRFVVKATGETVYEEYKGSIEHQDGTSKLRRRLAEVIYGINVKVTTKR